MTPVVGTRSATALEVDGQLIDLTQTERWLRAQDFDAHSWIWVAQRDLERFFAAVYRDPAAATAPRVRWMLAKLAWFDANGLSFKEVIDPHRATLDRADLRRLYREDQ